MVSGMGWRGEMPGDTLAWDAPEASTPTIPTSAGGGGVPAPQSEQPTTDAPISAPVEAPEPEDDPFEPVVTTADDGAEDDRDPVLQHPRVKALRKENRKLLRRFQKLQPIASAVKDRNINELVYQAEAFQRLSRAAEANPRLAALLNGTPDAPDPRASKARPAESDPDDDLTPDTVPFSTDDAVGKWLLERERRNRTTIQALQQRLDEVTGKVGSFEQMTSAQAARTERSAWKTKVDAAAQELPSGVRTMFMDAIHGAYGVAKERRLNVTPEQVIKHYLDDFKADKTITTQQAQRATAAAAQRMAEANKTLPRQATGGVPASVRSGTETVHDVNRRLRRFGT